MTDPHYPGRDHPRTGLRAGVSFLDLGCAAALAAALFASVGCRPTPARGATAMAVRAREELAAAPDGSDARVILDRALKQADLATPAEQSKVLAEALEQADRARRFTVRLEAPLPEGWPKPSLPGLVRVKRYPAVRSAWVRSGETANGRFMALFRHIKKRKIAMTAPVLMDYPSKATADTADGMAFPYRQADDGPEGVFGEVVVKDEKPVQVVSVGVKGGYTDRARRRAVADLRAWLKRNGRWREAGPPRVLGYHSPFKPVWTKYSEVQIPVEPDPDHVEKEAMPPLTAAEKRILLHKGTERPFTGKYWDHFKPGTYVCRKCGAVLYRSDSKFRSECGWPSFDDEVPGAVKRQTDADGRRTEIVCAACGGHLGHVFEGERLTPKNVRHCVNSASIVFRPAKKAATEEAIFAGGCFWGVEHYFQQVKGVRSVISGYTGGHVADPSYRQVCTGATGHAEAVQVVFDPEQTSYEELAKLFFEIHDPTQRNRQGPDVGTQYRSAVFYRNDEQKRIAEELIARLRARGYKVVTQVEPASTFYPAEAYHQNYIDKHPTRPICHTRVRRFDRPAK